MAMFNDIQHHSPISFLIKNFFLFLLVYGANINVAFWRARVYLVYFRCISGIARLQNNIDNDLSLHLKIKTVLRTRYFLSP